MSGPRVAARHPNLAPAGHDMRKGDGVQQRIVAYPMATSPEAVSHASLFVIFACLCSPSRP